MLLGERLIAFRTTSNRVGVMDHRCAHRCASLFYGRNEEEGIRCVYHGWKFDADGRCVDAPNVRSRKPIHPTIKTRAYRTTEIHGVIWVYMGQREVPPPLPQFPVLMMPSDRVAVWCMQRECNYLQALEGDLDTSHAGFLHLGGGMGLLGQTGGGKAAETLSMTTLDPEFKVLDTDWGVMAGAHRPADAQSTYWRFTNFLLPFFSQVPPCALGDEAILRAWVPMDDTHTMFFSITSETFHLSRSPNAKERPIPQIGLNTNYKFLPNTTDWYGRWRLAANMSNDHMIDREVQKTQSYTGIDGLDIQDMAVTESMGPIVDHDLENLAQSDLLVVRTRRKMLDAMRRWEKERKLPDVLDKPESYSSRWSGHVIAPNSQDMAEVYDNNIPKRVVAAA
jgi:phenylpropionate dioxygenase-like ring-hydroxylating dioxygenase large terminal subunit